jgi:hypothetical protein
MSKQNFIEFSLNKYVWQKRLIKFLKLNSCCFISNVDFNIYSSDFSTKFCKNTFTSSSSIDEKLFSFSTHDRKRRSSDFEDRRRLKKKRNYDRLLSQQKKSFFHFFACSINRCLNAILRMCDMNVTRFSQFASFLTCQLSASRTWKHLCSEKKNNDREQLLHEFFRSFCEDCWFVIHLIFNLLSIIEAKFSRICDVEFLARSEFISKIMYSSSDDLVHANSSFKAFQDIFVLSHWNDES